MEPPYRNQYRIPHDNPGWRVFALRERIPCGSKVEVGKTWEDVMGWRGGDAGPLWHLPCVFGVFGTGEIPRGHCAWHPHWSSLVKKWEVMGLPSAWDQAYDSWAHAIWMGPCDSDLAEQGSRHGCYFWFQHPTSFHNLWNWWKIPRVNTWKYKRTKKSHIMYDIYHIVVDCDCMQS